MTREELEKKLRPKQILFCKEYVTDWNATKAAKSAGYSEKTAGSIGGENLRKPLIKEYIKLIRNDFEELAGISKLKNLQVLAKVAYAPDVSHLHETWIDLKDWESLSDKEKAGLKSVDRKVVKRKDGIDEEPVEVEQIKVECFDRRPYIETINKMMGYDAPEEKIVKLEATKIKWGDTEIEI
jgi:phage terminase small subunit